MCRFEQIKIRLSALHEVVVSKNRHHNFNDLEYIKKIAHIDTPENYYLIANLLRKFLARAYYDAVNGVGDINVRVNDICALLEPSHCLGMIYDSNELDSLLSEIIDTYCNNKKTSNDSIVNDLEKVRRIIQNRNYIYYPSVLKIIRKIIVIFSERRFDKEQEILSALNSIFVILMNPRPCLPCIVECKHQEPV